MRRPSWCLLTMEDTMIAILRRVDGSVAVVLPLVASFAIESVDSQTLLVKSATGR